ncbi:hypothetical protein NDU88_005211 [Pleurodeles waltl]|uniref:Lamina-associated polypeptide 2 alpha C-terminal domain-containing protein n=1 Tax=Pleurodeles waltl TaxID=8319 RepID=A0AAV7TAB7_PLEWA|nr:hypothetical protein NDU88_005211 [Pleurodeles waltl]
MERTPFRFCPKCHAKYPYTDQHLVCNLCLSPEHKEDTCEACRAFRSKKTLHDLRARRLQMASTPIGHTDVEKEETFSIPNSDEPESAQPTGQQTVSKQAPAKTHSKIMKAQGTPPRPGHGFTRKHGDQASAPKKGTQQPKTSDSGQDTGSEYTRHRDTGSDQTLHREIGTPKSKKVSLEPKKTAEKVSVLKHPASEPKQNSYMVEQGLSSQLQGHKFGQELGMGEPDHTQRRLHIQKDTGKISTLPPIKMKRKLAFHEAEMQLKAKVAKEKTPPQFSPQPSSPTTPHLSPIATPPMVQSPTHTGMSQDDLYAWDLYDAPVSDNSPDCYPARSSPPEDSTAYMHVVSRAATFHNVALHSEPIEDNFLFNTLSSTHNQYQSLPMLPGMLIHAKQVFQDPVKGRAITPRVEKKYKPPPTDPVYITQQLTPDSVVVGAARKRADSQTSGDAPPPDKESQKFNAAGKRVAAQAANQWRIANSQALLARYDRAHWDEMQHFIEHLPKEFQKRAQQIVEEGQTISNNQIRSAMDSADTAARTVNAAVTIRRHAWLRTSGFKPEIQQAVLNMPFNGQQLFGPEVDTAIDKLKKDTDTAKPWARSTPHRAEALLGSHTLAGGFGPKAQSRQPHRPDPHTRANTK